ncbi:MAG: hypothetical protein JRD89_00845 [Deltaproteobacteria bacterium]|nr:hypothetical protein [Deltaproteobacteria bacterium]
MTGKQGIKVGDSVLVSYFGVVHRAKVIRVGRTRVRVRFRNVSGWEVEAWRPISQVKIVEEADR